MKAEVVIFPALNAVLIGSLLKIWVNVLSPVFVGMMMKGVLIVTIAAEKIGP
ncbi:hypothetical protein [Clostridium sp. KNHs216]|uniref:hypothetical protein n=1 Tax=Clostridium sp. KNHs216 TaxID=1550235 RepID=UPI001639BA28|nr:hypothetical protein [Clostridium sp. KNHs216]